MYKFTCFAVVMISICISIATAQDRSFVELSEVQNSWKALPVTQSPPEMPLPNWARAFARTLPYSTAAMLEFDSLLRADGERLRLRALAMHAVSRSHGCSYTLNISRADLRRSGASLEWLKKLESGGTESLRSIEQEVIEIATKLSNAPKDLSEEAMKGLVKSVGEDEAVAIVLSIGYANLLDRIAIALRLPDDVPEAMRIDRPAFVGSSPTGAGTKRAERPSIPSTPIDLEPYFADQVASKWRDLGSPQLLRELDLQKVRKPLISVPTWDEISPKLPQGLYPDPLQIRWSRVVVGHQPQLGPAWIKCLRVFEMEAAQDRVFEESIFWVVTRGLRCFYCMGHCKMLMEIGGLSGPEIEDRTQRLASGDWSSFQPYEQLAFFFANRLTVDLGKVNGDDWDRLKNGLGEERALDCLWWIARCQLMTKVSDGFQLQLETSNVFQDGNHPDAQ